MNKVRSLYLGHGAPTLALSAHPANAFLRELGQSLAQPTAVVVVSPHRVARGFDTGQAGHFHAWHDFGGFARELYALQYDPPGAPALAARVAKAIDAAGLPGGLSDDARIDHGIWVPLRLMWPQAQVPLIPVATTRQGPGAHLALGRALRGLSDEGVLVIGSGSITHNLGEVSLDGEFDPVEPWAQQFDDWIAGRIAAQDVDGLCAYRQLAPSAVRAHPTDEHLLPLFVALGAGDQGQPLYRGFSHGSISLSAYAFG